jgi:serine/threonine protein kinase
MSLSLERFWKLAAESQLLSTSSSTALAEKFSQQQGSGASAEMAARWLIDERRISSYQAKVLLAGRPGPFVYGDYRIHDRIESGRLSGIFRALHTETKHPVCLYFLSGAAAQDPEILQRLAQQAAAAHRASVGHPHLSRCYHLADEKSYKFIVLQDLQGKRLERRMATGGALPPAEACRMARQAALGLARLHAMGMVHGDVRPANLWLDPEGTCKLLLFPLARDPLSDAQPGELIIEEGGRRLPPQADYIAPEVIDGGAADARSDIYSLGCTLYHALANQPPFAGGDLKQKLARHRSETPMPLSEVNSAIPAALAKLVNYMLAKDPDLRYQQANSVVEALLPHLAPGEAETQPHAPSKRSQAYEAWLAKHLATTATAAPQLAASARAVNATPAPVGAEPAEPGPGDPTAATATSATVTYAPGQATLVADAAQVAQAAAVAQPIAATAMPVAAMAMPVAATAMPVAATAMPVQPGFSGAMPAMAVPMAAVPLSAVPMAAVPMAAVPMSAIPMNAIPMNAGAPLAMPAGVARAPAAHDEPHELAAVTMAASDDSGTARSRRAARKGRRMALLASVALIFVLAVAAGAFYGLGGKKLIDEKLNAGQQAAATVEKPGADADDPAGTAKVVDDSAKSAEAAASLEPIWTPEGAMWASPTHGKPIDVAFLAPGPEGVIVLRPAELLKNPQAEELLDPKVLGSLANWVHTQLPALAGTGLENIEQAIVGLLESGGATRLALVVHLKEPVPQETLLKAWGDPTAEKVDDKTFYQKQDLAYYVPKSRSGRVISIAPTVEMRDVVASDGQAALLPLHVERLLHQSDSDRLLTAIVGPGLMSTAGKGLFSGIAARLKEPVEWFLTGADPASPMPMSEPKAVMFSCHFAPDFFAELRVDNDQAGPDSPDAAKAMRERVKMLTKRVDLGVHSLEWTPYSENMLVDLPEMVRAVQQFTRVGTGDKQIVLRAYLPAAAAQNLALGTYLCLLENPRGVTSLAGQANSQQKPQTAADKLKKVISLSFPNNPLDKTIGMIADEIGVPIEIDGLDFKEDGITKNQAITNLNEQNKPAAAILRTIMLKARPDDKIVYVFTKLPDGTEGILLTTRAGVVKHGYKLPPELESQTAPKKK